MQSYNCIFPTNASDRNIHIEFICPAIYASFIMFSCIDYAQKNTWTNTAEAENSA